MLVLLVLGALWAVVLLPPLLRSRTERSSDSIGDFNYRLGVLGRTNGTPPETGEYAARRLTTFAPPRPGTAAKRRREVLTALLGAVLLTAVPAYASGATLLWALQFVADACLVAYLGLWAWFRSLQIEQHAKVRMMPEYRAPEFMLRRTGSS